MNEKREAPLLIFDRKLMEDKKYWHEQLASRPEPVGLPRYGQGDTGRELQTEQVDMGAFPALPVITRNSPFLAFAAVAASLKTCLFRISGQSEIVIGTPPRGAGQPNALVMKSSVSAGQPFKELLKAISMTLKKGYEHQRYPADHLLRDLIPGVETFEAHPFFQICASLEGFHGQAIQYKQCPSFHFTSDGDKLSCQVTYDPGLFRPEMLNAFLAQVGCTLAAGLEDIDRPVQQLPMLSQEADQTQRTLAIGDPCSYDGALLAHHRVAQQAAQNSDKPALLWQDPEAGSMTYGQLWDRSARLAAKLRQMGVGPETPVAVCMHRSPQLIVSLLAVWQAGGSYLPIDPEYPVSRLQYMVADAKPLAFLTSGSISLPEIDAPVLMVDRSESFDLEPLETSTLLDPTNAAYTIYTSGSTGHPKGVMITHAALLNLINWHCDAFDVSATDRASLVAGVAFDASVWEIWPYLTSGATLCIPGAETLNNTEQLLSWFCNEAISIGFTPTPLAQALMGMDWPAQGAPRMLLTGGDVLQNFPGEHLPFLLVNNYGLTECCVVSTSGTVPTSGAGSPHIGKPVHNTAVHLLDKCMQPTGPDFPGELYIGGPTLARGYRNRPALTASRFVPDPTGEGRRLYKTGDMARRLDDGSIAFLGRSDRQVQLRGYRIEPGEIEARLQQHPDVNEAVVIMREDRPGDPELAGYFTTVTSQRKDPADVEQFLSEVLPEYMTPTHLIFMESWPLTPHGKIDRKALPEPQRGGDAEFIAARTPGEEIISGIYAEVLQMKKVSVEDNFFELGGHSLLATQVASRLREIFSVELSVRRIFDLPTVAGIARYIENPEKGGAEADPIQPVSRDLALPASFAQQRMWFLQRLEKDGSAYNIAMAFELAGPLHVNYLKQAFLEIARRHEVLRTTFAMEDGDLYQVVQPQARIPFSLVDLRDTPGELRKTEARNLMSKEAAYAFDLEKGPLLRVMLQQTGTDRANLFVVMHHIVSDGWSMGVMSRELIASYTALCRKQDNGLNELTLQYADFSHWQRNLLQGENLEKQLDYWRNSLADLPPLLTLPWDRPRPANLPARGAITEFYIDHETFQQFNALCAQNRVTLFMGLLGVFNILMARYSRQDRLAVGTPVANRNRLETEPMIGFFVNSLVLSADLSDDPSFKKHLDAVRNTALGAYAHQDLPFDRIVDELQPQRSLSYTPLFQVFFGLQNAPTQSFDLPQVKMKALTFDVETSKYDLTLMFSETARGLKGNLQYHTDLFDRQTAERMMHHYCTLMNAVIANPDLPVSKHDLLDQAERKRLLDQWQEDIPRYDGPQTCIAAFEAQAERAPQRIALSYPDTPDLSYDQVNRRANQLARRLLEQGVRPGDRVGLLMTREPQTIIALLAVLKACAAYVPLDPEAPDERLRFMMEDSAVSLLLAGSAHQDRLEDQQPIILDQLETTLAGYPDRNLDLKPNPQAPIYCLYTSGTSGKPKGSLITHHNVMRLFHTCDPWFHFGQDDVWSLFHSLAFDFSVWEMWGALAYGGRLVIVPYWTSRSPAAFLQLLAAEKVTMLSQTPSAFRLLMEANAAPDAPQHHLRWITFGGEALDFAMLAPWLDQYGHRKPGLANMYGITETCVHVTFHAVERADMGSSVIGKAIPDLRLMVTDSWLQPLPAGVPGELVVGGEGLAMGYLGRPALTAQRFVPDPFSNRPGSRLYLSGDCGRRHDNNDISHMGRLDHQVKIRGFRIETAEIGAVLSQHQAVAQSVVLALENEHNQMQLDAFVICRKSADAAELRGYLKTRLPEYMVPAAFHFIDDLPLTLNGKLDTRALKQIADRQGRELADDYTPPRTPLEELLVDIWNQVLVCERIGVRDNFFALGGDSIRSIDIVAKAAARGLSLEPRQVYQHQTIEALALVAAANQDQQAATEAAPEPELIRENVPPGAYAFPLTQMQQNMLHAYQQAHPQGVYHCQHVYRLTDTHFSQEAFVEALEHVVAMEPILRTTISAGNARPLQVVLPEVTLPLTIANHTHLDQTEQRQAVQQWMAEDLNQPLHQNAEDQLLYRFTLILESQHCFTFAISIHHAIVDGWSHVLLLNRLVDSYMKKRRGEALAPAANNMDYPLFVALEDQLRQSEAAASFWKEHLKPWRPVQLKQVSENAGQRQTFQTEILPETVAGLRRRQRSQGVSFKSLLLSSFAGLFQTDGPTVTLGVVANGRTIALNDPLNATGLFWNMIPICLPAQADHAVQTHRALVDAEPYAGFPLSDICALMGQEQLFTATFNFIQFHHQVQVSEETGLSLRENFEFDRLQYPLNFALSLHPQNDGLLLIIEADPRYFSEEQVHQMAADYLALLNKTASQKGS